MKRSTQQKSLQYVRLASMLMEKLAYTLRKVDQARVNSKNYQSTTLMREIQSEKATTSLLTNGISLYTIITQVLDTCFLDRNLNTYSSKRSAIGKANNQQKLTDPHFPQEMYDIILVLVTRICKP